MFTATNHSGKELLAPYYVLVHACSPQVTYIDSSPQQMT